MKDEIEQVDPNVPRSMVIRMGRVGKYVKILKKNMRSVMSPNTALKLKVCYNRKKRSSRYFEGFSMYQSWIDFKHLP